MQERVIDRVEVYKLGGDSFLYFDGGENTYCENKISKRKELRWKRIVWKNYTTRSKLFMWRDIHTYI